MNIDQLNERVFRFNSKGEIVPNPRYRAKEQLKTQQPSGINNLPDLLTVREVANILRVSPLTLKRWEKRGKIAAIRINTRGDRRYRRETILAIIGN